jgi:hypothetical protein
MQHVDSYLNLSDYCCHVRDYTIHVLFQIYVSNRLSTIAILDLGIRTLHIFRPSKL